MADPRRDPHTGDDTGVGPARGAPTGLARWQKAMAIIGLLVVLALGILLLGGDHGPGRHAPDGSLGQQTVVEGGGGHDPSQWGHS
jgi:hypothetical protein